MRWILDDTSFPFFFSLYFSFCSIFFYSFFLLPHIIFFGCIGFMGISIYIYIDVLTVFLGWCSFFFFFFFFFFFLLGRGMEGGREGGGG